MKCFKKLNSQGLSLLEIIVALSIISVAFLSLMQAFPFSLTINKTAENATKAAFLAQAKIEQLRSLGYQGVDIGTIEEKHRLSENADNYLYYFQRETAVNYVDGNLDDSVADLGIKKISTNVYYTNSLSKNEKVYNLTTLINEW